MNVDPQKSETRPDAKSEATSSQKLTPTAFRAKHSEVYSTMCDLADLVSALEQNINDDVELRSVVFHHPPRATSNDWRLLDPMWQGPAVYSPVAPLDVGRRRAPFGTRRTSILRLDGVRAFTASGDSNVFTKKLF